METNLPKTLVEVIRYFSNPQVCHDFAGSMRWPNGVICPRCDCREVSFLSTRRIWRCKSCKRQFSVKIGFIFEDSPLGMDIWITAIWLIIKIGTFGKMTGMDEVDETFVGSLEKNKHADKKRHIGCGGIESGKHHLRSGHSGFADRLGIVFAAGKPHKRDRSRIHSGNMAVAPPVDLV